jgi:hypothetical protein
MRHAVEPSYVLFLFTVFFAVFFGMMWCAWYSGIWR